MGGIWHRGFGRVSRTCTWELRQIVPGPKPKTSRARNISHVSLRNTITVAQAVNGTKGSKPKLNAPGQDKQRNRQPDFERQGSILKKGHPAHATTETLSAILHLGVFPTKLNSSPVTTYDVKGEQDPHEAAAIIYRAYRVCCQL
jgi:hypothetical protein